MKKFVVVVGLLATSQNSFAGDEVINQIKISYGQRSLEPKDANTLLEGDGIEAIKKINYLGIEASKDLGSFVNLGLRMNIGTMRLKPTDSTTSGTYYASLSQVDFLVMLNFPLVKAEKIKAEIVSGVGASSSSLAIKTASQDGGFSSTQSLPTAVIGAAIAVGHKYVFLRIEGGYEYSKPGSLVKTGTPTGTLETLDLSGLFVNVGILIDGLKLGKM